MVQYQKARAIGPRLVGETVAKGMFEHSQHTNTPGRPGAGRNRAHCRRQWLGPGQGGLKQLNPRRVGDRLATGAESDLWLLSLTARNPRKYAIIFAVGTTPRREQVC